MKRQVAKVINNGIYKVIYDDAVGTYTLYKFSGGHQKKLDTYSDLESALRCIAILIHVVSVYKGV